MKFGVAMGIYSLTLAWLLTRLTKGRRFGWWVGTGFAVAGVLDVGVVVWAAAHGTFSHFNQNTDAVARTVRTVFSVGILPLILATLAIAILLLIQRTGDRALTRALRAGLGLAFASMAVALWLSGSGGATPRTEIDANGQAVSLVGAHGIGDPDGHGLFLTNWSTTGGDLRVPHFVGLHAIQVLLAVTAILHVLAARRPWLRSERVRARLVGAAAVGYAGVFAVLSWQAYRGQSVVHPDGPTLLAFAAVAVLTSAALVRVGR
jgi:FtsH-binding integral membrane protein